MIKDELKLRIKIFHRKNKKGEPRDYRMVFVTFSSKFSPILSKYKELHDVLLDVGDDKILLPKVNLYVNSYYYNKKTGERIPQYSFTIPVLIAERLLEKGVKKVKVFVEVPD